MTTDIVLTGLVVDGTGAPAFDGWVAVSGGRITAVGPAHEPAPPAAREVAAGAIAPGFIDLHTHSDLTVLVAPTLDSQLRQGVTTAVVGNCGSSPAPRRADAPALDPVGLGAPSPTWRTFGEWLDVVDAAHPSVDIVPLVGFGALRTAVMDDPRRPAQADEVKAMRSLLARCLDEGAVGMSTGLIYEPDQHAPTEEIIDVVRGMRGIYASHVRGEGASVTDAVSEAVQIGRVGGVQVQVSHLKCESAHAWGRMPELLQLLRDARGGGVEVWADSYPYAAYGTELAAFLPPWVTPDGLEEVLAIPERRGALRRAVERGEPGWQSSVDGVGWDRVVIDVHTDRALHGRSIADLGGDPFAQFCELLLADAGTTVVGHAMQESDVRIAMAAPDVSVCSDGVGLPGDGPLGDLRMHPRCWGTFPRAVGHYVRTGVLPLELAVYKSTGLPADCFGLSDRGRLRPGLRADVVCFDPETVDGPASYENPVEPPVGVSMVLVDGRPAWEAGRVASRRGRVVRRGS